MYKRNIEREKMGVILQHQQEDTGRNPPTCVEAAGNGIVKTAIRSMISIDQEWFVSIQPLQTHHFSYLLSYDFALYRFGVDEKLWIHQRLVGHWRAISFVVTRVVFSRKSFSRGQQRRLITLRWPPSGSNLASGARISVRHHQQSNDECGTMMWQIRAKWD
jgi:hypothetical protein